MGTITRGLFDHLCVLLLLLLRLLPAIRNYMQDVHKIKLADSSLVGKVLCNTIGKHTIPHKHS